MRIIAAYLLAVLGGVTEPNAELINSILDKVGLKAEPERVKAVITSLKGKNIKKLTEEGSRLVVSAEQLQSLLGAAAPAAAPAAAAAAPAKGDDKKGGDKKGGDAKGKPAEKKKEEKKEDSDQGGDMDLGGLF
eukprot:TRINITY_DN29_c0_g5_i1.p2 TRINITY_DN29_c0_g5~~TRINITY_DN29_c0_g5_i1.p2  ORF type:complete len:133 (+),score=57.32 TRINITY_DN29_c0_g5_i1:43-441(+)